MEEKKEKSKKEIENEEREKKKRQKHLERQIAILLIVLALAFISFMVAYQLLKPKPYFEYEGLKVYPAKIKGVNTLFYLIPISDGREKADIVLRNDPRKLDVSVEVNNLLDGINMVWITYPPYEQDSSAVLAGNDLGSFTSKISLNTSYAMTETNSSGYPEITCENATSKVRVFLITLGNETKVYSENNCIIVQGEDYDSLIKAADTLVVKWLLTLFKP